MSKGDSFSQKMCPQTQDERNKMSIIPYSNAVGSLMYIMMCTDLNICFVVGCCWAS